MRRPFASWAVLGLWFFTPVAATVLDHSDQQRTGTIATEIGLMTRLSAIDLSHNSFTGSLPTEIGLLTALVEELNLKDNRISGQVPSQLGLLTSLTERLILEDNSFSQHLPTELGNLPQLMLKLRFGSNMLSGQIPSQIGGLSALATHFEFHSNQLTGSVPSELAGLASLTEGFELHANELCGELPTELSALSEQVEASWKLTTGNDLGTPCCETQPNAFTCSPSLAPTHSPTMTLAPTTAAPTSSPTRYCGLGRYLDESGRCEVCEAGTYRNWTGAPFQCSSCVPGYYRYSSNDWKDALACEECPDGQLSAPDRSYCCQCSEGMYAFNETSCESCSPGKYAPTAQEGDCLTCAAGSHTFVEYGATDCSSCDPGTFSKAGWVNCSACPNGTYSGTRASVCENCTAGYYSSQPRSSTCTSCESGKYSNEIRASKCEKCDRGRFQSASAQARCLDCAAGRYTAQQGRQTCESCEAGTYSNSSASSCANCPAGKYSGSAAEHCTPCPTGYFSNTDGMSSCLKCSSEYSPAYTSEEGDSECDECVVGYYINNDMKCIKCPDHVKCDDAGVHLESLDVDVGWYRFEKDSVKVFECPYPDNCLGGQSTKTDDKCVKGSSGPLCAVCDDGYYLDSMLDQCTECEFKNGFLLLPLSTLVLLLIGSALLWRYWDSIKAKFSAFFSTRQRVTDVLDLCTAVLVTMQVIILLQENSKQLGGEPLQDPYAKFLDAFSFLALDVFRWLPTSCIAIAAHFDYVLAWTVAPAAVCAFGYFVFGRNASERNFVLWKTYFVKGLFLLLPTISTTICSTFRCEEFEDGHNYMAADYTVTCNSQLYKTQAAYAICMCLCYPIGVPVVVFAWLYRYRTHFDPPDEPSEEKAIQRRANDPELKKCSVAVFALKRKPRYWYFEVYNMLRRLALTSVSLVFSTVDGMLLFILAVAIITTVIERETQPEINPYVGAFVYVCCWQVVVVIIGMLASEADMTDGMGTTAFGVLMLLSNLIIISVVFVDTTGDVVRESRRRLSQASMLIAEPVIALAVRGSSLFERASSEFSPGLDTVVVTQTCPLSEEVQDKLATVEIERPDT